METITIDSIDDLPDAAERIIDIVRDRETSVVAFYGVMGAGKTTLIREIASQLDVEDNVTSPTFALVNQYTTGGGAGVNHFDFYRIDKLSEAFDMGYEEYFYGGELCLIEWPEKIEELLPDDTLRITIAPSPEDDGSRTITIQ